MNIVPHVKIKRNTLIIIIVLNLAFMGIYSNLFDKLIKNSVTHQRSNVLQSDFGLVEKDEIA